MLRFALRFSLCIVPFVAACGSSSPTSLLGHDRSISREDREILDEAKQRKADLRDLKTHPAQYVTMTGWTNYDKGIINDYSDVTEVVVHNSSRFTVSDIQGEFTFLSRSDKVLAKVPVTLIGQLRAGETKRLKAVGQTIGGKAADGRLAVSSVDVEE